jgi:hypothetical protein
MYNKQHKIIYVSVSLNEKLRAAFEIDNIVIFGRDSFEFLFLYADLDTTIR